MSSLANMLLGQAAPSSALSGLDPATVEALKALNGESGIPAQPPPRPGPSPTDPPEVAALKAQRAGVPAPAPAQAPGGGNRIMQFLMSLLPSTQSLAPQGQPTPRPPTPEELAARNQAIAGQ